jgi:IS30 family transposase
MGKISKNKAFVYLSDSDRDEIEILTSKGYSMRSIAKVLGRSPNTISCELGRCTEVPYRAALGKQYVRTNLKNRRFQWSKIESNKELKKYIIEGLKKYWNPDEIAGRMRREKKEWYASKAAIYTWLGTVRGERYRKYLYHERPGKGHHKKKGLHGQIPNAVSILERPRVIEKRKEGGHWESDCVVSCRSGTGGVSGDQERVSRFYVVQKIPDLSSTEKQKTLVRLTQEFSVASITFDRGHENVHHHELGVPTYFCQPYHSWEKGGVEHANKCLRRFFPKGTDFSTVSDEKLQRFVSIINDKPRKILGYRSALEVARELKIIRNPQSVLIQG